MEPVPHTIVIGRVRLLDVRGAERHWGQRIDCWKGGAMRFVRCFERGWKPALVVLLLAAYPAFPHAQTTSAAVDGTVQDPQGGVLPGVTVTLTSRTQGNALTALTDPGGRFVFPIVRPDTYTLQATLQGFKTLERTNVVVNANDRISTGVLALELGGVTEEIRVTSRVTALQTTSGERSFTLESETLKNIANNGRALFNFATLVPGTLSQTRGNTELLQVSDFTVNGQRPNSNNITIDGVSNIDTRSEEHTSELQSQSNLVCRLLLEKKNKTTVIH